MSYINAIETAVPTFEYTQKELADFYSMSTNDSSSQRKIKIISEHSGIEKRYSVVGDFKNTNPDSELFSNKRADKKEPGLSKRMQVYKREALPLGLEAISKIKDIDHIKNNLTDIITVTCTGMFAPGLDIEIIRALQLSPSINRSSINFMGCNAAILALKQADAICRANAEASVLIVCVELCTLHFQEKFNDDYILSNMLFGDGAVAVIVGSKPSRQYFEHPVEIKSFHSMLLHNGYKDMAWQLSETGFIMNLTSYVSGLIKENIKPMLDSLDLDVSSVAQWAIHPGGKRILDDFCVALDLDKSKLAQSYEVLKKYGNMSSPTVLFVLKSVLEDVVQRKAGGRVFSAAFGPGISIETVELAYV